MREQILLIFNSLEAALAHGEYPPLSVLALSDQKQQSSIRNHSLHIRKTRSLLPTLAPASHSMTMG